MNIENILSRLAKVKPNGAEKWIACCPAHDDRSPSLSIRDAGDRVLLHCFAGCETGDVLAAAGLSWGDVMPPTSEQARAAYRRSRDAAKLRRALEHEELILAIAAWRTDPLEDEDLERIRLAEKRIEKIRGVLHD
ncbi:MAG: CHC2 zinc finger domain-containing protein [Gammaproteobacteria bacterium]|nr:CHC2 zinc finger domain-containing protein [Gammaproteobacteria bacterium]